MDQVKFMEDSLWKIWGDIVYLGRTSHFKLFKACFPQILLGLILYTLSQMCFKHTVILAQYLTANTNNCEKKNVCIWTSELHLRSLSYIPMSFLTINVPIPDKVKKLS